MEKMKCLRCGAEMKFMMREKLQLGKTGWVIGDWGNLLAGALETAIFTCPQCGRLEFFRGDFFDGEEEETGIAQTRCSGCGTLYDLDFPKCPRCGAKNENW